MCIGYKSCQLLLNIRWNKTWSVKYFLEMLSLTWSAFSRKMQQFGSTAPWFKVVTDAEITYRKMCLDIVGTTLGADIHASIFKLPLSDFWSNQSASQWTTLSVLLLAICSWSLFYLFTNNKPFLPYINARHLLVLYVWEINRFPWYGY